MYHRAVAVFPTGGPGDLPGAALFTHAWGAANFWREDRPCIRSTADKRGANTVFARGANGARTVTDEKLDASRVPNKNET